jgi:hypothetical protein
MTTENSFFASVVFFLRKNQRFYSKTRSFFTVFSVLEVEFLAWGAL